MVGFYIKKDPAKKQGETYDVIGCKHYTKYKKMQKYKKKCRRERDDVIDCEQPWRKPKAEKQNKSAAAAAVGIQ